jgi:hypothetical protein
MSPSAKKPYGIQRICRAWKLSRAAVQRRISADEARPRGLANAARTPPLNRSRRPVRSDPGNRLGAPRIASNL